MSDVLAAKVLRRAAELIDQGHCKHAPARDVRGQSVWAVSSQAVSWCLSGWIQRAHAELTGASSFLDETGIGLVAPFVKQAWEERGDATKTKRGACAVIAYNNRKSTTGDDVAGLLRRSAECAEQDL